MLSKYKPALSGRCHAEVKQSPALPCRDDFRLCHQQMPADETCHRTQQYSQPQGTRPKYQEHCHEHSIERVIFLPCCSYY